MERNKITFGSLMGLVSRVVSSILYEIERHKERDASEDGWVPAGVSMGVSGYGMRAGHHLKRGTSV